MNDQIKTCHNAYQRALPSSGDGVVHIFEKLVGTPPLPSDEQTYQVYKHLLQDLHHMEDFEIRYPMAIVAFGSARLSNTNPYYQLAVEVGERLAERGYLVRTGAGPGIMDAVPVGWKRGSMRSSSTLEEYQQTQGIRIELPFEQAISTSIDTNTMMKTFVIRRTALIWNSRGILVFPGGLGTINEMIEAWTAAIDHKLTCPIVVIPYTFYKPFLDAIERLAVDGRRLISTSDFNMIHYANDVNEAVRLVQQPMQPKAPGTQFTLREKLIYLRHELGRGLTTVSHLPPAVIFMGSKCATLSRTDKEVQFIVRLAKEILSSTSLDIRLGVGGMIDEVVTESTEEEEVASERVQRILMTDELPIEQEVHAHFESRSAHCESLLTNAKAAFFLPGDIPTLNVLFALVCEIQTGRRSRMPVFLIGAMFWQPIVDGLRETLKGEQYIKEKDIDIMTVIDTSEVDIISKVMKRI